MNRKRMAMLFGTTLVLFLTAIATAQEVSPPSFRNLVAVGDSITAGVQNGSLNLKGQNHSFAALIARQIPTFLFRPLITEPGIPNELILVDPGPPPVLEEVPGESGTRHFPLIVPQNLAVPGQDVLEALTVKPDLPLDTPEDLILGVPSLVVPLGLPPLSQIEMAFALRPTFTLFWLGPNDVLRAALDGTLDAVTPFEVFQQAYTTAVGTILETGSRIVVGNIPDVTVIAYLTPAAQVAALAGAPLQVIGPALGIAEGDYVTAVGIQMVEPILMGQIPGPLPDSAVVSAAEVEGIRQATAQMNGFIAQLGATLNFPVVDVHGALEAIDQNGFPVGERVLTTEFLGGVFSLDGFHPTNTGHALIANLFIQTINGFYGTSIPEVNVAEIAASDPLVGLTSGQQDGVLQAISPGYQETLSALLDRKSSERILPSYSEWIEQLPRFVIHPGPVTVKRDGNRSVRPWGTRRIDLR